MNAQFPTFTVSGPDASVKIPALIRRLIEECERSRISYCYWRSGRRLVAALTGESDLDLLIDLRHQHLFSEKMLGLGFKAFPSIHGLDHPSVQNYLGYDEEDGRIFHVHAHFRLVLGSPLLKNYCLPWEAEILARAAPHPDYRIRAIDPAAEALLLVTRQFLESNWLDPVSVKNRKKVAEKFAADRRVLVPNVDADELGGLSARFFGEELAADLRRAFFSGQSLESDRHLRKQIQKYLAPCRMYGGGEAAVRSVASAASWSFGWLNKHYIHAPRPWGRYAPGGGRIIAVVGVDGSGKSTQIGSAYKWLSSEVDTMPIYFGTGEGRPALVLLPFKMLIPLASLFVRSKPKGSSHGKVSDAPPGPLYSLLMMVWATAVAAEKRVKLARAWRGARRGLVVIADRYPQNEILSFNDGPLLHRLPKAPQWLRAFESETYARAERLKPDLVIRLLVPPERTEQREPTMDRNVIRTRIADLRRLKFGGATILDVDAEQTLPEVTRVVKRAIWDLL
jgi:thymidylate kinase